VHPAEFRRLSQVHLATSDLYSDHPCSHVHLFSFAISTMIAVLIRRGRRASISIKRMRRSFSSAFALYSLLPSWFTMVHALPILIGCGHRQCPEQNERQTLNGRKWPCLWVTGEHQCMRIGIVFGEFGDLVLEEATAGNAQAAAAPAASFKRPCGK